jgi:hypothetical protein
MGAMRAMGWIRFQRHDNEEHLKNPEKFVPNWYKQNWP